MAKLKKQGNPFEGYDPNDIASAFNLTVNKNGSSLKYWLDAQYDLSASEQLLFDNIAIDAEKDSPYYNEEELKIKLIGPLFRVANVEIPDTAKVFYERALAAKVDNYNLAVIADCLMARPLPFGKPTHPYFFLQEFKKKRGEKSDPEGQLLCAMLIAQALNQDNQPIYGGYLFGTVWNFATLHDRHYCVSREYNASHRSDLLKITFILRKLKDLIQATLPS
jgi:hypothetical protein